MTTDEITIRVSREVADAYRSASEEDRRKMDVWASIQLNEFIHSAVSLEDAMNAMSEEAIGNGMTPEILDSILND